MSIFVYGMVGVMILAVAGAAIRRSREAVLKALALVIGSASIIADEVLDARGVPLTGLTRNIANVTIFASAIWVLYLFRGDFGQILTQITGESESDSRKK